MHAVRFGVPQKRKRVIIIGTRSGDPEEFFPNELLTDESRYVTTADAIGDLIDINAVGTGNVIEIKNKPTRTFQKFARGLISAKEYLKSLC